MAFVSSDGVRIHYEVSGAGEPLLLHHGFTSSLMAWRSYGHEATLARDYQVISLDARGHGESDKLYEPALYASDLMARDVLAVLDELGIERTHFWGHSMGARIGFKLAEIAPERFISFVFSGNGVFEVPAGRPSLGGGFRGAILTGIEQGTAAYVDALDKVIGPLSDGWRAAQMQNDLRALLARSDMREPATPELSEALRRLAVPCLLMAGSLDPVYESAQQTAEIIPGARFVTLEGVGHAAPTSRPDLSVPPVQAFLAAVRQG
jgi:pimeloyl-ACP methyl ester carboxylesterase